MKRITCYFLLILSFSFILSSCSAPDEVIVVEEGVETVTLTLIVEGTEGIVLEDSAEFPPQTNAFAALLTLADVGYDEHMGLGAFVTSLEGIEAPAQSFWALYVNDVKSPVGISSVILDADTEIHWIIEGNY